MFFWIMLLFIAVPLIEVAIFIEAGRYLGTLQTVVMIFVTGIVGGILVKSQGAIVIQSIKSNLGQGLIPANELIEGLFVLIGGAFLLTPGFFTDTIGLLMMLPPTRRALRDYAKVLFERRIRGRVIRIDVG